MLDTGFETASDRARILSSSIDHTGSLKARSWDLLVELKEGSISRILTLEQLLLIWIKNNVFKIHLPRGSVVVPSISALPVPLALAAVFGCTGTAHPAERRRQHAQTTLSLLIFVPQMIRDVKGRRRGGKCAASSSDRLRCSSSRSCERC